MKQQSKKPEEVVKLPPEEPALETAKTPPDEAELPPEEPALETVVAVTLAESASVQKLTGFAVRLQPGTNLLNADRKLLYLLRKGERMGKWKIEVL